MTTPQSLTEEDLRLLESLPKVFPPLAKDHPLDRLEELGLAAWVYPRKAGEVGAEWNRTPAAATLLATLKRYEALQLAAEDVVKRGNCPDLHNPGTISPMLFAEARDHLADCLAALSPDVLGDQKDKGKAALTEPERDRATAGSESSRPPIATGVPYGVPVLLYSDGPFAGVCATPLTDHSPDAIVATHFNFIHGDQVGEGDSAAEAIENMVIATRATSEEGNATGTPGAVSDAKKDALATPKVEDSVVEVGGEWQPIELNRDKLLRAHGFSEWGSGHYIRDDEGGGTCYDLEWAWREAIDNYFPQWLVDLLAATEKPTDSMGGEKDEEEPGVVGEMKKLREYASPDGSDASEEISENAGARVAISNAAIQVLVNLPSIGDPGREPTEDEEKIIRRELAGFYMQEGRRYWRLHQGDVLVTVHGNYLDVLQRLESHVDCIPLEQA